MLNKAPYLLTNLNGGGKLCFVALLFPLLSTILTACSTDPEPSSPKTYDTRSHVGDSTAVGDSLTVASPLLVDTAWAGVTEYHF